MWRDGVRALPEHQLFGFCQQLNDPRLGLILPRETACVSLEIVAAELSKHRLKLRFAFGIFASNFTFEMIAASSALDEGGNILWGQFNSRLQFLPRLIFRWRLKQQQKHEACDHRITPMVAVRDATNMIGHASRDFGSILIYSPALSFFAILSSSAIAPGASLAFRRATTSIRAGRALPAWGS